MRFNEVLKALRIDIDINPKDLANKLNVKLATYKNYENGTIEPNFQILINISYYFNVSTDYLLGMSEFKNYDCYNHSMLTAESELPADETELLKSYRKLSVIMKAEIRGEIKGILRSSKEEQPAIKKVKTKFVKRAIYFLLILIINVITGLFECFYCTKYQHTAQ